MAEFVALETDAPEWTGVAASIVRGRVRVRRGFRLVRPEGADAIEPDRDGPWLRREFDRLGLGTPRVLVSLPREEVVVRQLDVPDVPDAELPDLVRLQAETKASASLGGSVLDFVPLPAVPDDVGRHVLTATVSTERLERIRRTVAATGCELVSVGLGPLATAGLVAHVEALRGADPQQAALVVARHGTRVEISLLRAQRLVFTHSTRLAGEGDRQNDRLVLAEVRRAMGALSPVAGRVPPSRAWIVSTHEDCDLLRQALPYETQRIDPTRDAGLEFETLDPEVDLADLAGPLGMLLARETPTVATVDFLAPRKAVVPVDRRRVRLGVVAGVVAAVVLAAVVFTRMRVGDLEAEAERIRRELAGVTQVLEAGKSTLAAVKVVDEWERSRLDVPRRLDAFAEQLPGTDRLLLRDVRLGPASGDRVARLQSRGWAKSRQDVDAAQTRFAERDLVQPHEIRADGPDKSYPWQFEFDLSFAAPIAKETAAGAKAAGRKDTPGTSLAAPRSGGTAGANDSPKNDAAGDTKTP